MREESEVLEHHAGHLATEFLQVGPTEGLDIDSVDHDVPVGGVEQLVDGADRGGLAGARQAHDHEDLTPLDVEVDVAQANDVPGSSVYLSLAHTALAEPQRLDHAAGVRRSCTRLRL